MQQLSGSRESKASDTFTLPLRTPKRIPGLASSIREIRAKGLPALVIVTSAPEATSFSSGTGESLPL